MGEKARILIVDDEEVVRLSYRRILAEGSYDVETAWDGMEAMRLLEERSFDVVLLDLRMPRMDGMSLLRAIKAKWPESEVVIITGYPSIESAKEAVRLGAHNYLSKPVGPETVVKAASGAVEHKQWALRKEKESGGEENPYGYSYPWEN